MYSLIRHIYCYASGGTLPGKKQKDKPSRSIILQYVFHAAKMLKWTVFNVNVVLVGYTLNLLVSITDDE